MKTLSLDELKLGHIYVYQEDSTTVLFRVMSTVQVFSNLIPKNDRGHEARGHQLSSLGHYRLCEVLASSMESDQEHINNHELLPLYYKDCDYVSEVGTNDLPLYTVGMKSMSPETEQLLKSNPAPEPKWGYKPDARVRTVWACNSPIGSNDKCRLFGVRIYLKPHEIPHHLICKKCGQPLVYLKTEVLHDAFRWT